VPEGSDIQGETAFIPHSDSIQLDEKISIARKLPDQLIQNARIEKNA
jgi:hypothetical protein